MEIGVDLSKKRSEGLFKEINRSVSEEVGNHSAIETNIDNFTSSTCLISRFALFFLPLMT
jgi:hypothetical protein